MAELDNNFKERLIKTEMIANQVKEDVSTIKKVAYDAEKMVERHSDWMGQHTEIHKKQQKLGWFLLVGILGVVISKLMELIVK